MPQWFNGILTSPSDIRHNIAISPTALFDSIKAEPDFDQIIKVTSEVNQPDSEYCSDKVNIHIAVGIASIANTEALEKKKIVDATPVGEVLDALGSGLATLGLTPINLPLKLVRYFIPYQKAEKQDHSVLLLDNYKFEFGDDKKEDDARAPNRNHIRSIKAVLKFKGGFLATDDDGDSWFQISLSMSSRNQRDSAQIDLFGENGKQKPGTMAWSGNEFRVAAPRGRTTPIETGKKIGFEGTLTVSVPTADIDYFPLTLHFALNTYADSDFSIGITSNNLTMAWFEPFELTLEPAHR